MLPLSSNVNGWHCENDIAYMWKCNFEFILKSVNTEEHKITVLGSLESSDDDYLIIKPEHVKAALKSEKCSKAS